jgi:hypothetical protein
MPEDAYFRRRGMMLPGGCLLGNIGGAGARSARMVRRENQFRLSDAD